MTEPRTYVIAITGGIGSGKSVVSRVVEVMGYKVYDCDRYAKWLMDSSDDIKKSLAETIDNRCVRDGKIDRSVLSEIVFSDAEKLERLNAIVHGGVRRHLKSWIDGCCRTGHKLCFVETAILYQSGLDTMVDEVWNVEAPLDLRLERVMKRNGFTREQVLSRVSSQDSYIPLYCHHDVKVIVNDGDMAILPQVEDLLR